MNIFVNNVVLQNVLYSHWGGRGQIWRPLYIRLALVVSLVTFNLVLYFWARLELAWLKLLETPLLGLSIARKY
jgi:hypothetical protein